MQQELKGGYLPLNRLLKLAMDIYSENFYAVAIICLSVFLPITIIFYFQPEYVIYNLLNIPELDVQSRMLLAFLIVGLLAFVLFEPLAISAFVYITRQRVFGQPVLFSGIMDASLIQWGKHFVTSAIFITLLTLGFVCFIIPGIYFLVTFYFFVAVTVMTGKWGPGALIESRQLVKGVFARTMSVLFFISMCSMAVSRINIIMSGPEYNSLISVITNFIFSMVVAYFSIVSNLWFMNICLVKGYAPALIMPPEGDNT